MTSPKSSELAHEHVWRPDQFLDHYELLTLPLGPDPDGEDPISATLIRRPGRARASRGAVLYVHGFTDYFFQEELADYFDGLGYAFYGLDLRKCGRSLAAHHQPHFTTDLAVYDEELTLALDVITDELSAAGAPVRVVVAGHSTGGLVTPLWLDRLRETDPARHDRIAGLLLNAPWLDMQGEAVLRTRPLARVVAAIAKVRPKAEVPRELSSSYGESLHVDSGGEWSYDLERKPLGGFPVTFGWLNAIRQGQFTIHDGIDVGVPVLVLRSDKSHFSSSYDVAVDTADCVLDVSHMARWAPFLGRRVLSVVIPGARHDAFLSKSVPRELAYEAVGDWMRHEIDPAATTEETDA
ncbi:MULTISPECIES: alpha/beta hydrolase [unclassified Gordonia (in: high G+C Gram-positive bacteria)]|uniref:alpha/beta hydrolase n=1 Tax=unclassified Gordonia (in: high G+C Gram-positive bacteria) TaxID=2657482 RepID=UPI001FFF5C1C|nr:MULTISPECIES: alpha/beta hydrolase [unclassified Gordonia (in: high G+C Gram-positive bacteria)]UQE73413.1 alpha/beta hydrolase [Gordonia sp. PP30]